MSKRSDSYLWQGTSAPLCCHKMLRALLQIFGTNHTRATLDKRSYYAISQAIYSVLFPNFCPIEQLIFRWQFPIKCTIKIGQVLQNIAPELNLFFPSDILFVGGDTKVLQLCTFLVETCVFNYNTFAKLSGKQ